MKYSGTHLLVQGEDDLKNYNEWIINMFLRNVQVSGETRVLDFGAGVGTLSLIFNDKTGLKPDCVEIDPEQREMIEKRGFKSFASLEELKGKYDLIFTSNVLEHIENDEKTLEILKSRLTESGVLIIFVPAFEAIWSSMDDRVGHYRRYKKNMLKKKLEGTGFFVKKIHYCDSLGFALSFVFKYLGSKSGEPSPGSLRIFDRVLLPFSKLMDLIFSRSIGKNLLAIAASRKPQ